MTGQASSPTLPGHLPHPLPPHATSHFIHPCSSSLTPVSLRHLYIHTHTLPLQWVPTLPRHIHTPVPPPSLQLFPFPFAAVILPIAFAHATFSACPFTLHFVWHSPHLFPAPPPHYHLSLCFMVATPPHTLLIPSLPFFLLFEIFETNRAGATHLCLPHILHHLSAFAGSWWTDGGWFRQTFIFSFIWG